MTNRESRSLDPQAAAFRRSGRRPVMLEAEFRQAVTLADGLFPSGQGRALSGRQAGSSLCLAARVSARPAGIVVIETFRTSGRQSTRRAQVCTPVANRCATADASPESFGGGGKTPASTTLCVGSERANGPPHENLPQH